MREVRQRHKRLKQVLNLYVSASHSITCKNQCDSDIIRQTQLQEHQGRQIKETKSLRTEFFLQTYPTPNIKNELKIKKQSKRTLLTLT